MSADVAVKILTDVGVGSSRVSGGEANFSTATWDKVRLEKLLHEVGALLSVMQTLHCAQTGEGCKLQLTV